jgi:hypothetical protein
MNKNKENFLKLVSTEKNNTLDKIKERNLTNQKTYIGTYKVLKVFKESNRREVIMRGLSLEEAKSMVVFMKQFSADKYFVWKLPVSKGVLNQETINTVINLKLKK